MADFAQYTFQQGRRVGRADMTEANAWESLSNSLSDFASTIATSEERKRIAAVQQHNADVKAYINSQEDDIITHIGKLSIDNENDYNSFITKANAFKKGKLDAMSQDPELGADFASGFGQMADDKIAQYGQKVYQNQANLFKAENLQVAQKSIETHAVDTENMIDSAVNMWHESPGLRDKYLEDVTPQFQTQRDMFAFKVDELLELGVSGKEAFKQEQALLNRFYKKAAMAELTANMEEGNGWQTIQDFNANPSKFFSSRPQLQALFPEVKISMSDEDKNETFKEMMQMLNGYQGQQDRIADARAKDKLADQEFLFSNIQSQIADDPTAIEKSFIQDWLAEGKLNTKQHDSLLKTIQTGGLYREDDNVVSGLWDTLFDPTADQFAVYDQIRQAVDNQQITPQTQKAMLGVLRDGALKDVTKDEDYQMAINEVKTEFRTTGMLKDFNPNESRNISRAIRDLYQLKKTLRPDQDFWQEVDKIKAKYKRVSESSVPKVSWRSNWVGTAEEPNVEETKRMLAEQFETKQLPHLQFLEQVNAFDDYMESYNLRKSR